MCVVRALANGYYTAAAWDPEQSSWVHANGIQRQFVLDHTGQSREAPDVARAVNGGTGQFP